MELLETIIKKAIRKRATDIHLTTDSKPVYRVRRILEFDDEMFILNKETMEEILEYFEGINPTLKKGLELKKQKDFSYMYDNHRFRINVSYTRGAPTFSIRVIPNGYIDIKELGIDKVLAYLKPITSGLILVTGKVNSGKSTTMNAYIQEINKTETKKIVSIEDPIEYEHTPDKCIIIQKEVGTDADVLTYYDGLINLLREDSDINVVGEIRDRATMNVAIDLAESGGLVIGTLHTRSCGETIDRIVNMYEPQDQSMIKASISSILKLVISQKLVPSTAESLILVPEIMTVNSTISALIRQEKFSISDIEDAIHTQRTKGCLSYEHAFVDLYNEGHITMQTITSNIDPDRLETIKKLIINFEDETKTKNIFEDSTSKNIKTNYESGNHIENSEENNISKNLMKNKFMF